MGAPELVLEENSLHGNKEIHLEEGVYFLEITDLDENAQNSVPIKTKIIVDRNNDKSVDEVIIKTDFDKVTTVEFPNEEYAMVEYIRKTLGEISNKFGTDYTKVADNNSNIDDYLCEGPVSGIFYEKISLPPIIFGFFTDKDIDNAMFVNIGL